MSVPRPTSDFYDELSPAARRMARVPRIARLIARLPLNRVEKLGRNASEADVFWETYNYDTTDDNEDCGLLAGGLKTKEARCMAWRDKSSDPPPEFRPHQIQRARDLLGAIAFELLAKTDAEGKPAPWWNGVADNLPAFKKNVQRRFIEAEALISESAEKEYEGWFNSDWHSLMHMNSHGLEHFIFSTHAGDEQLRWADITTMAFFAAYWACRWATPEELTRTRKWVVEPLEGTNEEFHEFWTMAVEMPDKEIDRAKWIALFAPLYGSEIHDGDPRPLRSTEFIYRSWERMERWKGEPLRSFLEEFQNIRKGDQGEAKKRIAETMLAEENLISLVNSEKQKDDGRFPVGVSEEEDSGKDGQADEQDNPPHWVTLSHFLLHRFCVSNEEFELFESGHYRWNVDRHPLASERPGGDDKCPVVNVSWYDAACFVKWLGIVECGDRRYRLVLPGQAQWEYGCRCGETTPFTFAKPGGTDQCRSGDCNFDGRHPFPDHEKDETKKSHAFSREFGYGGWPNPFPGDEKDETGKYRGYTLPVGEGTPNLWGFYHMHGNVWEWCASRWSFKFKDSKVLEAIDPENFAKNWRLGRAVCGGSWHSIGSDCQSGLRGRRKPLYSSQDLGFRLAAILAEEQGKADG